MRDRALLLWIVLGLAIACAGVVLGMVIAAAFGVGTVTETVIEVRTVRATVDGTTAARCRLRAQGLLPDHGCTPGLVNQHVRQSNIGRTICRKGWAATVRPPRSVAYRLKRRVMAAYGVTGTSRYQLDHLIPLELGGDPLSTRNLWPEAYAVDRGARSKDQVENRLRRDVCAHHVTLAQARRLIRTDWRKALNG